MNRHFLLLRPDRAGDAIKTLPTLRALQEIFPEDHFHVLGSQHNTSLFAYEKGVKVYSLPTGWEGLTESELKKELSRFPFPETFDSVVNLLCDRFPPVERLVDLLPATQKFSIHLGLSLPQQSPVHRNESENIALLAGQAFGCNVVSHLPRVSWAPLIPHVDEEEAQWTMGEKKGYWVGICPFAGNSHRTHPEKHWRKFFKQVSRSHQIERFFLFGAKKDRLRLQEIQQMAQEPGRVTLVFPSSFRALGAHLQRVDGVVAVDSGPLHLAHSLKIPSLGFLSGGDHLRWFPTLQEKDHLLRRGLFSRYPLAWEMVRAFKHWSKQVFPVPRR